MDDEQEREFTSMVKSIRFVHPPEALAEKPRRVNKPTKRQPRVKPKRRPVEKPQRRKQAK